MAPRLRVGLFAPCFVDRLAPEAAVAAWHVLRALDVDVFVAQDAPACCGQPLSSMGAPDRARDLPGAFARAHTGCDVILPLSASCTAFVRHHHAALCRPIDRPAVDRAPPTRTFAEVLWHDLGLRALPGCFDARVGLHMGCHALRELGLGPSSERPHVDTPDIVGTLLSSIDGVTRVWPARADECCGFGGVFSVREPDVAIRMARDRRGAFAEADVLTSTDPSCLLHMARARGTPGPRILSFPELLAEAMGVSV